LLAKTKSVIGVEDLNVSGMLKNHNLPILDQVVPALVQEALENTAVRISGQVHDKENNFGAGRVDVFAAFNYGKSRNWWG